MLALERIPIVGRTFRVTQIPIAERAAPSAHFTRGFVPWRLSDDGPGASRTISMSRHPKPITPPDIGWPGLMMATRHRLCHDAHRRLKQINPQMPARDSRRGNSLADHFFIFKAAPSKVVTMACISPSLVM